MSETPTGFRVWHLAVRLVLARRLFAVAVRCIHWAVALVREVAP